MGSKQTITIQTTVNEPIEKVWEYWTEPKHIKKWNTASADWHTTAAENELLVGGKFRSRMEAKDGSMGFDFSGTYDVVTWHQKIAYTLDDNRKVIITFNNSDGLTQITEIFEAEEMNTPELQKAGWQSILDHFKEYTETK